MHLNENKRRSTTAPHTTQNNITTITEAVPPKKKLAYKLFTPQEGAFAFASEADLMQPFYALRFAEHDLAYQLEKEELEKRKSKKKTSQAMAIEMRHKLKESVKLNQ